MPLFRPTAPPLTGPGASALLRDAGSAAPLRGADVGVTRERTRLRRLTKIAVVLGAVLVWMWWRLLSGSPVGLPGLPNIDPLYLMSGAFFALQ